VVSTPTLAVGVRLGVVALACATALVYFTWRAGVLNPALPVYAWLVLGAEVLGFLRMLAFLLSAVSTEDRTPPTAPPDLDVDVFITTYGEPVDVVRRTVMAALAIRYPHATWLLDDGNREAMRAIARELGCRYLTRTDNVDAKAGNLNRALAAAHGAYVAVFDADHVADPRFLDRTLGYFVDERVGFVQTPHAFYNHDSFEHLSPTRTTSNGQSFFHQAIQRSRDAAGATLFTGSSAVFRRRALDDVRGFAAGTVTEDVETSVRLHAHGWQSVFHGEILSAGMAPVDAAGFSIQRLRWAQGAVEVVFRERLFRNSGLTAKQRRWYLMHVANNIEGLRYLVIYALPIVMLVTGTLPVTTDAANFLARFVPYALASMLACRIVSRGHLRIFDAWVYNLARCPTSVLACVLALRKRRYRVTPKARDGSTQWIESAFPTVLALATLAAIAFAVARSAANRSPLGTDAVAVLSAWALLHVAAAARLLLLTRRCATDRRRSTRFPCDLPARFTMGSEAAPAGMVGVTEASADGLTFRQRATWPLPAVGPCSGTIELGGELHRFSCTVWVGTDRAGAVLSWPDAAARARFDLALHYRVIERLAAAPSVGLRSAPISLPVSG
jgi:cellulose synthase (UDP-forming)